MIQNHMRIFKTLSPVSSVMTIGIDVYTLISMHIIGNASRYQGLTQNHISIGVVGML